MSDRDDMFHNDTKEGEYSLRNRDPYPDFIELRKFDLILIYPRLLSNMKI